MNDEPLGPAHLLGDAFYRLEVSSFDLGIAVHEFATAREALDALAAAHFRPRHPVKVDGPVVRFEGHINGDVPARVVLSHYARTANTAELHDEAVRYVGMYRALEDLLPRKDGERE